ncbi:MAG: aminotransferase class V-fold PLP-dependent enzyme [Phycisphaera sp.]|nr:aminotransferase class V-fold PLP-dependent enzyme [Phycisphaera sp.]
MERLYLDSNATTRPAEEVVEAVARAMRECWANPSSVHRAGGEAKRVMELARESVAKLVGCQERELVFTSGGTEGANLAIRGSLEHFATADPRRRVLVTTRFEHSAVRELAQRCETRGTEVAWLPGGRDAAGTPDLDALEALLAERADQVALVSLIWANNETGAITDIARAGALCREHGVRFHTDATQWVGKMPTDLAALQVDLASFAAHKFHGPKGVGALYVRRNVRLTPQTYGGPQERERRGGTENVAAIGGFGVASDLARAWLADGGPSRGATLRDGFERTVAAATGGVIHAQRAPRLWNTTNIGFARLEAEAILLLLSERGVFASAGAACSSGSLDPSPVLLAMGIPPEIAHGSIRFSLSRETTSVDCDEAARRVIAAIERLRTSTSAAVGER